MWMDSPSITPSPVASPSTPPTVCWLVKKRAMSMCKKYDDKIETIIDLHVSRLIFTVYDTVKLSQRLTGGF